MIDIAHEQIYGTPNIWLLRYGYLNSPGNGVRSSRYYFNIHGTLQSWLTISLENQGV